MGRSHQIRASTGLDWRGYLETVPSFASAFSIDPGATGLLVIDMQQCFTQLGVGQSPWLEHRYPDIAQYYHGRLRSLVLPNIRRLLEWFRERGERAVFLTVGPHLPDGSDFNPRRRERERELITRADGGILWSQGSAEHRIHEELTPGPNELVVNKVSRSAFNSTALDQLLRNMRVSTLVGVGVVTNGCVAATLGDAVDRGYRCCIVEDACAAFTQTLHDTALLQFAHGYGEVLDTDAVVRMLDAK